MPNESPTAHATEATYSDPAFVLSESRTRAHDLLDRASRALTVYSLTADLRDGQDVAALLGRVSEVWTVDLDALDVECSVAVRWYALRAECWSLNAEFASRQWWQTA